MNKGWIITTVIALILIGIIFFFMYPNKGSIKIDSFSEGGDGQGPPTLNYTLVNEKLKECVIYTNDGISDKLRLPTSCPVIIDSNAPNGRTSSCSSQSKPSSLGKNSMELWDNEVSLDEVKSVKICCASYKITSNDISNVNEKDLECSKSYFV